MEAYYTPNPKFYLKYETTVKENNNYKKFTGQRTTTFFYKTWTLEKRGKNIN